MSFDRVTRQVARDMTRQVPQAHFDDLYQEGRLAIWLRRDALARLDPDHARRSAAQCARWAMLDWARKMWPGRGNAGNLVAGSVDAIDGFDRPGPDDTVSAAQCAELIERIQVGIHASCRRSEGRLTRRRVLDLMVDGAQGTEIAETLGLRPETVSLHKVALAAITAEFI